MNPLVSWPEWSRVFTSRLTLQVVVPEAKLMVSIDVL